MKKSIIVFVISILIIISIFIFWGDVENKIITVLNSLKGQKLQYSFFSFLFLASDIILPIPSSIVMFLNGYVLGIILGSMISLLSLLTSAVIGYYIGQLTSWGYKANEKNNTNVLLNKYGTLSILITRGVPILSESVCILCGFNRIPFKQYFLLNLIGYFPLCLLYGFCGSIGYDKNMFFISFGCSLLISASFWLLRSRFLKITNY
jgi:uncharacterized membrane protein YdjX (TVP38/TMEM64 family)